MDETWIHHFTPEANRQSAEWTSAGESRPKQPKTQTSAGKVLASVFWDAKGILFIDYLEKKVIFHQDNTPCHKSIATMAKLHELHFELLPHPPYSPELAPNNYWLFTDIKRMLQGKRFGFNEEVISETEAYFEAKDKLFYKKASNCGRSVGISVSP